jgi:DNA-binding SARP family transcriptional activator
MLVATSTADAERRTQAVLDNGSGFGLAGVVLGQWRPGGTARVRADGTIGATSPSLADSLSGARLFTLPENDTTELLKLLQATEPHREEAAELALASPEVEHEQDASGTVYEFGAAEVDNTEPDMLPEPTSASDHASIAEPSNALRTERADLSTLVTDRAAACQPPAPSPGSGARHLGEPEPATLHLQVLGRLHLTRLGPEPADVIESLAPRQREILVYLALHRNGSRRETLSAALWPDAPGDRPYNSFHATLSQLRGSLRKATRNAVANIAVNDDGHYGLDRSLLTVDLWQLDDALTARRRATTPEAKVSELRRAVELYRGDFAEGIAADWIDGPREALRREVLEALSALIRTVGDEDPEQTLALLEQARGLDRYNEAIYRDLMRTQARLGQYDSVPRTLNLLASSLADLDQRPSRDTVELAGFLRRPRNERLRGREAS